MDIETVDEVGLETGLPEKTGEVEETKRLGPEVISGKVVDPWVDEDQFGFHEMAFTWWS
jgi:hypothetical protein